MRACLSILLFLTICSCSNSGKKESDIPDATPTEKSVAIPEVRPAVKPDKQPEQKTVKTFAVGDPESIAFLKTCDESFFYLSLTSQRNNPELERFENLQPGSRVAIIVFLFDPSKHNDAGLHHRNTEELEKTAEQRSYKLALIECPPPPKIWFSSQLEDWIREKIKTEKPHDYLQNILKKNPEF
jgi:hypothetical protein